jgi:hypothetical protein
MNDPQRAPDPSVPPARHVPHIPPADLRGQRLVGKVDLHVPTDMAMYAALAGKPPEIDPTLADPMKAVTVARRENPWSPVVLSLYLRQICREKALKINKPELASWLRRQSTIAKKRFAESQARINAARSDRAA